MVGVGEFSERVKAMTEVGTLRELNVQPGDVVGWDEWDDVSWTIKGDGSVVSMDGVNLISGVNYHGRKFRIISRATPTVRLEVGKRYELNNGEVHECTRMMGDDPLAVNEYGYGPFVVNGMCYHQDGRFANSALPDGGYSVKRCVEPAKTLQLEEGKYYMTADGRKVGPMGFGAGIWHCSMEGPLGWQVWHEDGRVMDENTEGEPNDYLIAEWYPARDQELTSPYGDNNHPLPDRDTPKTWGDMTPEEKGALLLAEHEGKVIERKVEYHGTLTFRWHQYNLDDVLPSTIVRVRPEPKRGTVVLYGGTENNATWGFYTSDSNVQSHRITFDTINGDPDFASIKMDKING